MVFDLAQGGFRLPEARILFLQDPHNWIGAGGGVAAMGGHAGQPVAPGPRHLLWEPVSSIYAF